jgi:uncharacterized membrane protein
MGGDMIEVSTEQVCANHQPDQADDPTISAEIHSPIHYIVAQPNQSASWQVNKVLILALGLPFALIATAFSLAGAWLLLPFAGLEITGIGAALYVVCKRLQNKHVLIFDHQQLKVEKGCGKPEHSWMFDVSTLAVAVERQAHPWDALKISLYGHSPNGQCQQVSVGDFLNKQDSQKLLNALRKQGLPVRSDSTLCELQI